MALSHLGKLYDQVLKIKYRASDCFKKCLELAATLVPRILTTERKYFYDVMVFYGSGLKTLQARLA